MPPKKKGASDDLGAMRAARFGRVKNDLAMGFVGLPNVGKSTLTNLLAGAVHAEAANYPFCTIDPNVVQAIVPDLKFKYLVEYYKPPSIVPAVLKIVDIAGLIKGASEGAGLGNAFLSHIAAVDGIFHLVRAFDNDEVIHVDDSVDPIRDLNTIEGELCLKDLDTLSKVLDREKERVRKEKGIARANDPPLSEAFLSAFDKCNTLIQSNTPVQTGEFTQTEVEIIKDWGLITTKPQVYVINMTEKNFIRKGSKWLPKIADWVKQHGGGQIIPMSCEFEQKLFDLQDDPDASKGTSVCETNDLYIHIHVYINIFVASFLRSHSHSHCDTHSLSRTMLRRRQGLGAQGSQCRCEIGSPSHHSFGTCRALFAILLYMWTQGSESMDDSTRNVGTTSGRCHSYRL